MVRTLEYDSGINMEEAKEIYEEIKKEFDGVKSHYSGFFSRFKRTMNEKDQKTLSDCIGILLPLSHEKSVVEQTYWSNAKKEGMRYEDTLYHKVEYLTVQITDYLANFRNTGVKRIKGCDFFE